VYEGKWVEDAPVCGEYRAPLSDELALFGLLESVIPEKWSDESRSEEKATNCQQQQSLPILELRNPDEVLTALQKGKE